MPPSGRLSLRFMQGVTSGYGSDQDFHNEGPPEPTSASTAVSTAPAAVTTTATKAAATKAARESTGPTAGRG
jgi:hypothetical protein